jgi:hypothetical protein
LNLLGGVRRALEVEDSYPERMKPPERYIAIGDTIEGSLGALTARVNDREGLVEVSVAGVLAAALCSEA